LQRQQEKPSTYQGCKKKAHADSNFPHTQDRNKNIWIEPVDSLCNDIVCRAITEGLERTKPDEDKAK